MNRASTEAEPEARISGAELQPWSAAWVEHHERLLGPTVCAQVGIYCIPAGTKLSVIIPVFNEADSVEALIRRVIEVPIEKEIILIDDGSRDDSVAIIMGLQESLHDPFTTIDLIRHASNRGKGAAITSGFAAATGDIVIVQDADLEYDPHEFPLLIKPIVEGKADVVYGSRFLGDHPHRVLYYWHYLGNKLLTTLSNCFTNLNLTDMETCYKVFRSNVIREITPTLRQQRFGIEPEITAKIARRKYRVYEMAISYSGRTYAEGKKIGWRDGFNALWCIIRYGIAD